MNMDDDSDLELEQDGKLADEFGELNNDSDEEAEAAVQEDSENSDEEDDLGGRQRKTQVKRDREVRLQKNMEKQIVMEGAVFGNTTKHQESEKEIEKKREAMERLFGDQPGEKRESFTMNGYVNKKKFFDEKDEEEPKVVDAWLIEMDENGVKERESTVDFDNKVSIKRPAAQQEEDIDLWDARRFLLRQLMPGDNKTVLDTLRKLKPVQQKRAPAKKNVRKKTLPKAEVASSAPNTRTLTPEQQREQKEKFEKITKYANHLLMHPEGDSMIYQATYEKLKFLIRKHDQSLREQEISARAAAKRKRELKAPVSNAVWEYKWSFADEEVHGPFTAGQMTKWQSESFFQGDAVCRKRGQSNWKLVEGVSSFVDAGPPATKKFRF